MILSIIAGIIGVAVGWFKAVKRKGNTLDKMQYAAGFGIAFTLFGYFLSLALILSGIV